MLNLIIGLHRKEVGTCACEFSTSDTPAAACNEKEYGRQTRFWLYASFLSCITCQNHEEQALEYGSARETLGFGGIDGAWVFNTDRQTLSPKLPCCKLFWILGAFSS